jgi:hypothetical protein
LIALVFHRPLQQVQPNNVVTKNAFIEIQGPHHLTSVRLIIVTVVYIRPFLESCCKNKSQKPRFAKVQFCCNVAELTSARE